MQVAAANAHLHPAFQAALSPLSPWALAAIKQAAYVQALKDHDWSFEFSDDHQAYRAGRESLAQLRLAQRELDGDFSIWNAHCHPKCRDGASYC